MKRGELIVALDVPTLREARRLVRLLTPRVRWFKIGSILFTTVGPAAIALVQRAGSRVFLDLKYHDIPNTVAQACAAAMYQGIDMVSVHISGGCEMLESARDAVTKRRTKLIGITRLTSDRGTLVARDVLPMVRMAHRVGLDGVVAPPHLITQYRRASGDMTLVTPGVRPSGIQGDEHVRPMTPAAAITQGTNYIVMGRPIVQATDPAAVATAVLKEMRHAR
jgi:orotidine-5'-phosphate decarboxylase